ncbi:MAG: sulfurtransferase complex subunit TusB [Gammaproteobacteria bacterium]|nr:sulfurtransferase complex subunit TusB [Gammaproteobacteria bacterium]
MSTLHIVNKSPFRSDALQRCLALVAPGDSILLIEDGVLAASLSTLADSVSGRSVTCYALIDDLAARGVSAADTCIRSVDATGFVNLIVEHRNSLSHG